MEVFPLWNIHEVFRFFVYPVVCGMSNKPAQRVGFRGSFALDPFFLPLCAALFSCALAPRRPPAACGFPCAHPARIPLRHRTVSVRPTHVSTHTFHTYSHCTSPCVSAQRIVSGARVDIRACLCLRPVRVVVMTGGDCSQIAESYGLTSKEGQPFCEFGPSWCCRCWSGCCLGCAEGDVVVAGTACLRCSQGGVGGACLSPLVLVLCCCGWSGCCLVCSRCCGAVVA